MRYHHLSVSLLAALFMSCASDQKDKTSKSDDKKPNTDPIPVGIVEFVNPDQKFVLIKMQGRQPMPIGQSLTALDATGALTQLTVSPERKGTHVTADIKSGNPRPGNLVIYQPDASTSLPVTPAPVNPNPPITPNNAVEWRDGQPPPIAAPEITSIPSLDSNSPQEPLPVIPLEPLPEEPSTPGNP